MMQAMSSSKWNTSSHVILTADYINTAVFCSKWVDLIYDLKTLVSIKATHSRPASTVACQWAALDAMLPFGAARRHRPPQKMRMIQTGRSV